MNPSEKEALVFHAFFTLLCGIGLLFFTHLPVGPRLLFLVVVYNLALPLWARLRDHEDWINLWQFALILSVFQVFPDWFLSAQLDILVFPDDGCFKIGTVAGYMAGLWTIPLFIIIFLSRQIRERFSEIAARWAAGLGALFLFGGSEATLWLLPSWYAKDVLMIGHVAIYILVPEIILGLAAYGAYQTVCRRPVQVKIFSAFFVMLLYLGSACFFYFLVEKIIRPVLGS